MNESSFQLLLSTPAMLRDVFRTQNLNFSHLCPHARWRQVCWRSACAVDLVGTRRSQPQERQQLLLHDTVVQQPHPPTNGWEESAWEGDGRGQRKVQDGSVWHPGSVWVWRSTHYRREWIMWCMFILWKSSFLLNVTGSQVEKSAFPFVFVALQEGNRNETNSVVLV